MQRRRQWLDRVTQRISPLLICSIVDLRCLALSTAQMLYHAVSGSIVRSVWRLAHYWKKILTFVDSIRLEVTSDRIVRLTIESKSASTVIN